MSRSTAMRLVNWSTPTTANTVPKNTISLMIIFYYSLICDVVLGVYRSAFA